MKTSLLGQPLSAAGASGPVALRPAAKPAASPARRHGRVSPTCNLETQKLFSARVAAAGYTAPVSERQLESLHPIAREAWDSIHQIYGARCFETPLLPAPWLAEPAQAASVTLKAEWQQASGSYRARGAAHKMSALADEALQRGVVAAGSVNHTLAVLHAARVLGAARGIDVPVRLFLPGSASPGWADKLREQGGSVEVGGSEEEAEAAARAAAAQGASFLAARNDAAVAGGLGSLAIELLMQLPRGRLDAVFVPVSGGGLVSGIAAVLKAASPHIHMVGCRRSEEEREGSGGAGGVLESAQQLVDEWVTVGEAQVAQAVVETVTHSGKQVDASTGVAVAAFQQLARQMAGKHVVIVACGGNVSGQEMERMYEAVRRAAAA